MKHIALLLLWIWTIKSSYSQNTFPKLILFQGDSVVALLPGQLKTLNSQIALLIEYKNTCDSTVVKCNEIVESFKLNDASLRDVIVNQNIILENKETEISNLNSICKNKNKIWRNRFIYGSAGGLAVGLIAGLIISR